MSRLSQLIPDLDTFGAWDQILILRAVMRERDLTDNELGMYRRLWNLHGDKWLLVHKS